MLDRRHFIFLNIGHFLDHFFLLIFASAAALVLSVEWQMTYGELIPYSTSGFIAFGLFSPSGWLADRWSREGMMSVFFVGIGLAKVLQLLKHQRKSQSGYSPSDYLHHLPSYGLALIAKGDKRMGMDIAVNGVWGNMGGSFAAFITGLMIDQVGWRAAFWMPSALSVCIGAMYFNFQQDKILVKFRPIRKSNAHIPKLTKNTKADEARFIIIRISAVVFFTTAVSSIIFQGTTFALPKIFEERLSGLASSASMIGFLALVVFATASFAQIVVGQMLDRLGPKVVFLIVSAIQIVFFSLFIGTQDFFALFTALFFMLGAFGQIPISDFMIGKMAKSEFRASIYGVRYVISFAVWAIVVPLISFVHLNYGFDYLFYILTCCALSIFIAAASLPKKLPDTQNI